MYGFNCKASLDFDSVSRGNPEIQEIEQQAQLWTTRLDFEIEGILLCIKMPDTYLFIGRRCSGNCQMAFHTQMVNIRTQIWVSVIVDLNQINLERMSGMSPAELGVYEIARCR